MIPGRIPNPFRGSIVLNKAFFRTVETCGYAKDLVEMRFVGLEAMIPSKDKDSARMIYEERKDILSSTFVERKQCFREVSPVSLNDVRDGDGSWRREQLKSNP